MRILVSSSIVLLSVAFAAQSSACDRHGGMFGQLGGASWTDYNPRQYEADALFLEEKINEWHEKNAVSPAEVKPAKPSFSKASSRASSAAQAKLAKRAILKKKTASPEPSIKTTDKT